MPHHAPRVSINRRQPSRRVGHRVTSSATAKSRSPSSIGITGRDDPFGSNLDTIRQALAGQTTAKEHAERSLEQTQATIRDLQTQLAYERLAKDEALEAARRAVGETRAAQQTLRTVQDELLDERLARQNAEQEREEVMTARMTG
jgi:hypothetical protein